MEEQKISNSKVMDSSGKIIFGDPVLCAQFLRGYVNIPILKDVQPEDIEDVSERYVHLFVEERNSDVVKKVRLKGDEMPFYLISLIEHKAQVDYNVVMQILRYMVFIWEDYEKEQERENKGIIKTKGFKYPPVLPIIYYGGEKEWTASVELQDRIFLSDLLEEYIPNFKCILVQLRDYSNSDLLEKKDELSILMLIGKLQDAAQVAELGESLDSDYLNDITSKTPEYLLGIMTQIIEILLRKLNVPQKEAEEFSAKVKERPMADFFANFKGYDVQATRREEREKATEEGIEKLVKIVKKHVGIKETAQKGLMEEYNLTEQEAIEKVEKYW